MPRGERFYYRHRDRVVDGTRCNDENPDVCIEGKCQVTSVRVWRVKIKLFLVASGVRHDVGFTGSGRSL